MGVRKFFKKMAAVSLTVLVAVTAIPYSSPVKADDYPDDIRFPVRILDYPIDDMLMEYYYGGGGLDTDQRQTSFELYRDYYGMGNGKGLVEDELTEVEDENGNIYRVPKYKKKTLEIIAEGVKHALSMNQGIVTNKMDPTDSVKFNPLSMQRYIHGWGNGPQVQNFDILNAATNDSVSATSGYVDTLPEDLWQPKNPDTSTTYKYKSDTTNGYPGYTGVKAVVYESPDNGVTQNPVYLLLEKEIVLLSDIPVSKTFGGTGAADFKGTYQVRDTLTRGDGSPNGDGTSVEDYKGKVKITVNDVPIVKNSYVRPDVSSNSRPGKMEVTIQVSDSVADVSAEAPGQLAVGDIALDFVSQQQIGTYEQSEAKFKSDPKLGKTHITTCMDYAYFMTSHFFVPHPSTGTNMPYNDFESLIFHKVVDENGKVAYEFAADQKHTLVDKTTGALVKNPYSNQSNYPSMVDLTKLNEMQLNQIDRYGEGHWYWYLTLDDGSLPSVIPSDYVNWYERLYLPLIYNKTDKTIRNAYGTDISDTTKGDELAPGGYMYILDRMWEDPTIPESLGSSSSRPADWNFDSSILANRKTDGTDGDNKRHNFNFTIASNSKFVYKRAEKQYFYFSGDDDVYVFVNGHLFMDLGGAHVQLDGQIYLPDIEDAHPDWIKEGEVVNLDFFYMERRSAGSNFYGKLNFKLASDNISFNNEKANSGALPYGELVDLDYSFSTLRELTINTNVTFKDNFGNVVGAEGFELTEGTSLKDNKLIVTVKDKDGNTDSARTRDFEFADPNNPTAAEVQAVMDYFKNLDLVQGESVSISGLQYDTSVQPYDDYEGSGTGDEKCINFSATASYDSYMDVNGNGQKIESQKTHQEAIVNTYVELLTGEIKVCTASVDNEMKELDKYGEFAVYRDLTEESIFAQSFNYINDPENDPKVPSNEKILEKYPRGKYTIMLDQNVLTSYKITINDEEPQDVKVIIKEGDVYKEVEGLGLTIDFEPSFDPETKTWTYPDVKFELKAKRNAPPLNDLT